MRDFRSFPVTVPEPHCLINMSITGAISPSVDVSDGNRQPAYLLLLFIMYGMAFLPNMYCMQFLFTGAASGYVAIVFFNMLTGKLRFYLRPTDSSVMVYSLYLCRRMFYVYAVHCSMSMPYTVPCLCHTLFYVYAVHCRDHATAGHRYPVSY